jgi:hypothetical protein
MSSLLKRDFSYGPIDADYVAPEIETYVGDAHCLDLIGSQTIDLMGDSQQALHSMENRCKTTIYF